MIIRRANWGGANRRPEYTVDEVNLYDQLAAWLETTRGQNGIVAVVQDALDIGPPEQPTVASTDITDAGATGRALVQAATQAEGRAALDLAAQFAALAHTHLAANVTDLQPLLDAKAASVHAHAIADVTSLQGALDTKAPTVHAHSAADITSGTLDPARLPPGGIANLVPAGGTIASLTVGEQALIDAGDFVTEADGEIWAYSGTGSKTAEASYVRTGVTNPDWTAVQNKPTTFPPSTHTHPDATASTAGFMTAAGFTKLGGIEAGATGDQTAAEIKTAFDGLVPAATQVEAQAGTATAVRQFTPARVREAILALTPQFPGNGNGVGANAAPAVVMTTTEAQIGSVTITPSSTTAKIFLFAIANYTKDTGTTSRTFTARIRRGTTNGSTQVGRDSVTTTSVASQQFVVPISYVDTPGVATATTYSVRGTAGAGVASAYSLVAVEIASSATVSGDSVAAAIATPAGSAGVAAASFAKSGATRLRTTAQHLTDLEVTPLDFGAIGDGTSRPLSTIYGTLVAAQAVYPHAVALTDELDWAAAQAAHNSGAARVRYPGGKSFITNRPLDAADGQETLGDGYGSLIENIWARNTPSADQYRACVFNLGSMHPVILDSATVVTAWGFGALNAVGAGDATVTVTTPGGVPGDRLVAGEIVCISSTNTANGAIPTGVGFVYDYVAWNRVVSFDRISGVLVLEDPIPVAIVAATSNAAILEGPRVWWNAGTDNFALRPWKFAVGQTFRGLRMRGLVPFSYRSAAWRCVFEDIIADRCQHMLEVNAWVHCTVRNLRGSGSGRQVGEVKQWSRDCVFEDITSEYWLDSTAPTPGVGFSIGEQSENCVYRNLRIKRGSAYAGTNRCLEVYSSGHVFQGVYIEDLGGTVTYTYAVKSSEHQARPPTNIVFDELRVIAKAGRTGYCLIGQVNGSGKQGDPDGVLIRNARHTAATAPTSAMAIRVDRGINVRAPGLSGDLFRVTAVNPGQYPQNASFLGTALTTGTITNGSSYTTTLAAAGVQTGDTVLLALQVDETSWEARAFVSGAGTIKLILKNVSGADASLSSTFYYLTWERRR